MTTYELAVELLYTHIHENEISSVVTRARLFFGADHVRFLSRTYAAQCNNRCECLSTSQL